MNYRIVELDDFEKYLEFDRELSWELVEEDVKRSLPVDEYSARHRELVERLARVNLENKFFAAVDENGRILGVAWAGLRLDTLNYVPICYLYDLEVLDEARNCGIGSRLLEAVENYCRSRGVARLALMTPVTNRDAIRWYHKRGFRVKRLYLEKAV